MHALVTAPIPSHPQNHGNRARVFAVCRELQARGYQVHYVYSGMEGLTDDQEQAMRETWDHVYILPREKIVRKRSRRGHHLIDDWCPPDVADITNRILGIWDIKLCVANYVWLSAWLEDVPSHIPRYIDTHDVFGNRHKALKRDGLAPNWFYTTPREEAKALARASTVLAIQDAEAETFRKMTETPVRTLGFFDSPRYLAPRSPVKKGGRLKVGYIASDNPINVNSLKGLTKAIARRPDLIAGCDFTLAGPICNTDAALESPFTRLGFVPSVKGFYEDMDLILNPNIGGTGLKIKSVEALSFGRPLLATRDAMIGIPSTTPMHDCATIEDLSDCLADLLADTGKVLALGETGRQAYDGYQRAQTETLDIIFPRVGTESAEASA